MASASLTRSVLLAATLAFIPVSVSYALLPPTPTPTLPALTPSAPALAAKAYVLMDYDSGAIIASENPDVRVEPASLTKMMTMYVIDQEMKNGKIHWDDKVRISEHAWRTQGSKMFVRVDTEVPVKDLVRGIIIQSGNDASIAMAEHIAGSEEAFAELMNQQAKLLGMNNTHFQDPTGLPHPEHYTTAHDMAILARAIIHDFPQSYEIYSEKWFVYNGIRQPNRNLLLWRNPEVDGIKTGHTESAGYCLVSSAKKNGSRMIAVLMGAPSINARADDSQKLLGFGFRFFESRTLYANTPVLAHPPIWMGSQDELPLGVAEPIKLAIPQGQYNNLKATLRYNSRVTAPAKKGDSFGTVTITLNDKPLITKPLVALQDVPKGSLWRRFKDYVSLSVHKWVG